MTDPNDPAACTIHYNGLYCDGPCQTCDEVARDRAEDAEFTRRQEEGWR